MLNTGAQWHMLPQSCPNYKTVHRCFQQWCQNEVIRSALTDLANLLRREGVIDESECYIDATFASAKGGGEEIGPHKSNRKKPKTQDGRRLRRYERRWIVERFFAWLQWQRRLLVWWEFIQPTSSASCSLQHCASCSSSFEIGSTYHPFNGRLECCL